MSDGDDKLRRVLVDLPNHWFTGGESMWAFLLDDGTYQIDNVPFYAYGINYRDIVSVDSADETGLPIVKEVVTASGHDTIRVFFSDDVDNEKQETVISEIQKMNVSIERATDFYVALDIPEDVDYDAVRDKLDKFEASGVLQYETCEPRAEGRFDDGPDDDEENVGEYEN